MDNCPISGKPCPNRRVIHVTDINSDGSTKELHLCEGCGGDLMKPPQPVQKAPPSVQQTHSALAGIVSSIFGLLLGASQKKAIEVRPKPQAKPPCPQCGITLAEIAKLGRIGCDHCYDHFHTEIKIVTSHAHGATKHVGKVPKNWTAEQQKKKEIEERNATIEERIRSYKEKMANCIKVENYEAAGDLKKLIESLQQQLVTDVSPPTPPFSGDQ